MSTFSNLKEKIENWMSAIAFAEANDPETALDLAGIAPEKRTNWSISDLTTAITFAEAGEHDIAREYLGVKPDVLRESPLKIPGVKVWLGTVMEPDLFEMPGVKVLCGTVEDN